MISGVENKSDQFLSKFNKDIDKKLKSGKEVKEAQSVADPMSYGYYSPSWFLLGLIERMLQPVRGSDWTTYNRLEPYVQEVKDEIEKAKQEKGRDGLSFEEMLRIHNGENDSKSGVILEKFIDQNRSWL